MLHGVGVLFLSAIGGYWVLERAATHKGSLRAVGQVIGGIIIIASLLGAICALWCPVVRQSYCPIMTKPGSSASALPRSQ